MDFLFPFFFWRIIHGISLPQEKMLHKTLTEIQQETQGNIPKYHTNQNYNTWPTRSQKTNS